MKFSLLFSLIFIFSGSISCAQEASDPFATLTVSEFRKAIQSENILLVDVRTPEEYQSGKIKEAVNWNIYDPDFMDKFNDIDKEKPIYLYCKSGGRSSQAAKKLTEAGFEYVHHLDGGILAWKSSEPKE